MESPYVESPYELVPVSVRQGRTGVRSHAHARLDVCAYAYARIRTHVCTHTHAPAHVCAHAYARTYARKSVLIHHRNRPTTSLEG